MKAELKEKWQPEKNMNRLIRIINIFGLNTALLMT